MSRIVKHFLFAFPFALLILLVHGQSQSGFISLDCGLPETSNYTDDEQTGINFISDATFIDSGETNLIQPSDQAFTEKPYWYLRSFPEGIRNCYKINVTFGTKYLIRAGFYYGNYDGKNKAPEFELHLGPNLWDVVNFTFSFSESRKELIYTPMKNYIHVCLVNTSKGVPLISSIELRPLTTQSYPTEMQSVLGLVTRYDIGSSDSTSDNSRFPTDIHDRIWETYPRADWKQINTSSNFFNDSNQNYFDLPSLVMSTAATPENASDPLDISWYADDNTTEYYIYMHFADVEKHQRNRSRQFNITMNGKYFYGPFIPDYLDTTTIYNSRALKGSESQIYYFSMFMVGNSTLPPILNAYEVFAVKNMSESETNQEDIAAITNIKLNYNIEKNWQGDPCAPQIYIWEGLNCSYPENDSPRIISLNLSSSGLTGDIPPSISNLKMIKTLDLSNNNLKGPIPDFLSLLVNLSVINLENNNLTGSVPLGLIEKMNNGSLSLSFCENPDLNGIVSCEEKEKKKKKKKKKKKNFLIPAVVSIVGASIILLIVAGIWWIFKRKNQHDSKVAIQFGSLESTKRTFTYFDLLKFTNNFETVLGKGGFGTVYLGYIEKSPVAIKMLSSSSIQGFQQFQAEVDLLMRVHHKKLTSLVGYCNEDKNVGLVYEYMAKGNLQEHFSDTSSNILKWEDRLQIAADSAQGLEYLHHGCKPPIIHRDVKSTNILLDENLRAKLSDFGLSRIFPSNVGTHVSTVVAGTPGYLDPEYHLSGRLNEKSDVYSFGIVLLEIVTGRPILSKTQEIVHISQWVSSMLVKGDIYSIVDPRLGKKFNVNSVWKVVEIAMACVSPNAIKRPTMSQVVAELNECLATELAQTEQRHEAEPTNSIEMMPEISIAMLSPTVR